MYPFLTLPPPPPPPPNYSLQNLGLHQFNCRIWCYKNVFDWCLIVKYKCANVYDVYKKMWLFDLVQVQFSVKWCSLTKIRSITHIMEDKDPLISDKSEKKQTTRYLELMKGHGFCHYDTWFCTSYSTPHIYVFFISPDSSLWYTRFLESFQAIFVTL